jgi:SAM-dependent methyltransferase
LTQHHGFQPVNRSHLRGYALRALAALSRSADRVSRFTTFLAAAITPLAVLRQGTTNTWDTFSTEDHGIDSGFLRWEAHLAERYLPRGTRVLIVGCGTGRDTIPMLQRGCTVVGIDPAAAAIDVGRRALRERGFEADLRVGFFEDSIDAWTPDFDVVWFSWFAYSYIPGRRQRLRALAAAMSALRPDGLIIISTFDRFESRLSAMLPTLGRVLGNEWGVAAGDSLTFLAGSSLLRYQHHFTEAERIEEFSIAGLRPITILEGETVHVLRRDVQQREEPA